MKRIAIILITLWFASGCNPFTPEEVLLPYDEISLSVKGDKIMSFDESTCQLGYNSSRNEFRVLNDKLTDWIILKCSDIPRHEGQVITCDLEYTTTNDIKTLKGIKFEVQKTNEEGMVWLWEKDRKTGLIIKVL